MGEFSLILHGGCLLQQYATDCQAAVEQDQLNYNAQEQKCLRADEYSGAQDCLVNGEQNLFLANIGKRVILPSSFIGGPCNLAQNYHDAMALAHYFGKVDLFITITTNPAYDVPDLIACIFQQKKEAIIKDIVKKRIFGNVVSYVYATKFQKHLIPHIHALITLTYRYKLLNVRAIFRLSGQTQIASHCSLKP